MDLVRKSRASIIGDEATARESLRILSVVTRFGAGGPPLNVIHLARGLERYGYETIIAAGACSLQDADMSYLLTEQDKVEWIPSMSRGISPRADFVALLHLIRLVRQYKPDILHTHTAKAGVLGRLAGWVNRTPLIIHTFHGSVLRGYFSIFPSWCVQKVEQCCAALSDVLCVLSHQQHYEIVEEFRICETKKVRIIPIGLALDEFEKLSPPPLKREELVVAWLGRLVAIKNVPLLMAVVEQSLSALPGVRFLIAGDGPERAAVKVLVDRSGGRVEYLGWVRDVATVIARADLIILTSINEGTPTALIQGMAAARPFISTAVGGVPDMVIGESRIEKNARWFHNAVLVPPEAASFVSALGAFAADRSMLSKLGFAARPWAIANYAESKMLEATHQLYVEYLSAKGYRVPPPLTPMPVGELAMTQLLMGLAEKTGVGTEPSLETAPVEHPTVFGSSQK